MRASWKEGSKTSSSSAGGCPADGVFIVRQARARGDEVHGPARERATATQNVLSDERLKKKEQVSAVGSVRLDERVSVCERACTWASAGAGGTTMRGRR